MIKGLVMEYVKKSFTFTKVKVEFEFNSEFLGYSVKTDFSMG